MAKAELKTQKTKVSVDTFLGKITDEQKRKDAKVIVSLMERATKAKAKMWGPSIIGFGDQVLKYESGRELDWFIMGFSPRKQSLVLYVWGAVQKQSELRKKLGKHKTGKGCLYINKLADVDLSVLKEIITLGLPKK